MPRVDDTLTLFDRWLEAARASMGYDADAMVVATATSDGAPSARVVLLKGVDERGLVFFTNYSSRKGAELAGNPRAALLFYWHPLGRPVRIEGAVSRADRAESEAYARSRPRQSRLSALASPQSEVVPDRAWLERRVRGSPASTRRATSRCATTEAASASRPTPGSSGRTATTGCTTAIATPAAPDGWPVERLAP